MTDQVETKLVKGQDGKPLRINASDFNPDEHEEMQPEGKFAEPTPAQNFDNVANGGGDRPVLLGEPQMPVVMAGVTTEIGAQTPASSLVNSGVTAEDPNAAQKQAESFLVGKDGKKFFVLNQSGQKVARDGIDAEGYTTEQKAWDAIVALPK